MYLISDTYLALYFNILQKYVSTKIILNYIIGFVKYIKYILV